MKAVSSWKPEDRRSWEELERRAAAQQELIRTHGLPGAGSSRPRSRPGKPGPPRRPGTLLNLPSPRLRG